MNLAPSGNSPGNAGWANFAKLLKWCPGWHGERVAKKRRAQKKIAMEGHLDEYAKEVSKEEFLSDPSKCRASYVLFCEDHEGFDSTKEFGIRTAVLGSP